MTGEAAGYRLHDWVIQGMEIKQITEVNDEGKPNTVSDGMFSTGYRDFTPYLRPLTLRNKNIASYFKTLYDELHALRQVNLNYPDWRRYFEQKCLECIDAPEDQTLILQHAIRHTQEAIVSQVKALAEIEIDGVKLFRR